MPDVARRYAMMGVDERAFCSLQNVDGKEWVV